MQGRKVIQAVFFFFFFSIGAAALSSSVLSNDLVQYYQNKQLLRAAQESLERLKSLNSDYDILLERLKEDPNLVVERLAPVTLGTGPVDANTVYPRARSRQLAAARKALMEEPNGQSAEPMMPEWLNRSRKPSSRIMLFASGVVLILTSFVCFRPTKQTSEKEMRERFIS